MQLLIETFVSKTIKVAFFKKKKLFSHRFFLIQKWQSFFFIIFKQSIVIMLIDHSFILLHYLYNKKLQIKAAINRLHSFRIKINLHFYMTYIQ